MTITTISIAVHVIISILRLVSDYYSVVVTVRCSCYVLDKAHKIHSYSSPSVVIARQRS